MSVYNLVGPILTFITPIVILIIPFLILKIKQLDIVRRKYYSLANITVNNHEKPEESIKAFLKKYNNLITK
jgi:hypothetical protein